MTSMFNDNQFFGLAQTEGHFVSRWNFILLSFSHPPCEGFLAEYVT